MQSACNQPIFLRMIRGEWWLICNSKIFNGDWSEICLVLREIPEKNSILVLVSLQKWRGRDDMTAADCLWNFDICQISLFARLLKIVVNIFIYTFFWMNIYLAG